MFLCSLLHVCTFLFLFSCLKQFCWVVLSTQSNESRRVRVWATDGDGKILGETSRWGGNGGQAVPYNISYFLKIWVCQDVSVQKHFNEFERYTCNFKHQNLEQRSVKQCQRQCTTDWLPDNSSQSCFSVTDIHETSAITILGLRGVSACWNQPWCCLGRCVLPISMNIVILALLLHLMHILCHLVGIKNYIWHESEISGKSTQM